MAKTEKVVRAGLPAGVKLTGGQQLPLDAASIRLVMEGWQVKRQLDEAKARLEAINAELVQAHGACTLAVTGVCRVNIAERTTLKVEDAVRLRAVLGTRFDDLVTMRVTYTASEPLVQMATDADEPLQPALAQCLSAQTTTVVSWRAER
ncbi:MAG: hypothetical protein N2690_05750 [Rhodocyclaceae bacterium]|nr:hypothetical protein [Rhodocyclaceae bacterium]